MELIDGDEARAGVDDSHSWRTNRRTGAPDGEPLRHRTGDDRLELRTGGEGVTERQAQGGSAAVRYSVDTITVVQDREWVSGPDSRPIATAMARLHRRRHLHRNRAPRRRHRRMSRENTENGRVRRHRLRDRVQAVVVAYETGLVAPGEA